jgi:filamentous hemagglutinin
MTIKVARLLSGRVPIVTAGNVSADRYQFLSLGEAEPNLGTSALGNVLTTDTSGSRIWTNSLSISSITLTANLTAGNIVAGGFYFANGTPFTSSSYGNASVAAYLPTYSGTIGGDITIGGNLTVAGTTTTVNNEVINTTEYVTTIKATTLNAVTIGNIGSNLVGSGTYITGVSANSANISLYQNLAGTTANKTFYPAFYDKSSGNAAAYTNGSLTYNSSNGTLTATTFSGAGTLTTLTTSSTAIIGGNAVMNSGATSSSTTTGALVIPGTGGAGIGGSLYVGGSLNIANTGDVSANIGTVATALQTLNANVGAFETYANANAAAQAVSINSLATNANANTAAYLTTATGNIQAGNLTVLGNLTVANIIYTNTEIVTSNEFATGNITATNIIANTNAYAGNVLATGNVTAQYFVGSFAGTGTGGNISGANVISANTFITSTGIFWANGVNALYGNTQAAAYLPIDPTITGIQANVGAFEIYSNANVGTIKTALSTLDANIGAFEIYANANAASQQTAINSLYTNANANTAAYLSSGSIASNITTTGNITTTANIQAAYVIGNFVVSGTGGSLTGANLVSASYVTAGANVQTANLTVTANAYIGNVLATQYLYANGVSILTSIGGTYSNTNVAAYLSSNTVSNISTTGNITSAGNITASGNVYGSYLVGNFLVSGTGGQITGANLISASYVTATANVTTANITATNYLYPNGASILTGIGGTYSNTNVAGYLAGNITTGNITNTGAIASTGNVTAAYFIGNLYGTGGTITGGNLISANYVTATSTLTAGNISTTNGVFWANGVSALGSYGNTQVAAYLNSSSVPTLGTSTSNTTVAGNLVIGGNLFVQGNLTYVNTEVINTTEYVATVNATSINAATIGNVGATGVFGNISAGNINVTSNVYATSFIGNLYGTATGGSITNANLISGTYLTATANVTTSNLIVSNSIIWSNGSAWSSGGGASGSTFGNANLATLGSNVVTTTGNVNAGNINVTSNVYATSFIGNLYGTATGGSITNANLISGTYLTATSNVTTANIIATNYLYPNGQSILTGIGGTSSYGNSNVAAFLSNIGSNSITTISNISAGNITTTGIITATGNVTAPNFIGNFLGSGTGGQITGANLLSATYVTATTMTVLGNATAGNVIASGFVGSSFTYANNQSILSVLGTSNSNTTVAGNLIVSGNLFVTSNVIYVNTEVVNTTEYVATVNATSINAATIGNIGAQGIFGNIQTTNGVFWANGSSALFTPVGYTGTLPYANVANYTVSTPTSSGSTYYPQLAPSTGGNVLTYGSSALSFVPSTGTLTATTFSGSGSLSTLNVSSTSTLSGVVTLNSGTATNNNNTGALVITGSGGLAVAGNVNLGNQLFVGSGAQATVLISPVQISRGTSTSGAGTQYTQTALINATNTGSSDFIAYGDNYPGTSSDHGWMDVGYTGSTFNDPAFTITGANDGYVFAGAVSNSLGGNLVLATDSTGSYRDVVVAVGSFYSNAEVARFHGNATTSGYFALKQGTAATSTTTGALQVLGGAGITGNLWAGNVLATGFFYANGTAFVGGGGGTSFTGGQVTSGIYANGNLTLDLGTASAYWRSTYTGNIITSGGIFWSNGIAYSSGGGGSGSAAGTNLSLQYNNGGSFGGTAFLYFTANSTIATATGNIEAGGARSTTSATPPANPSVGDTWYNSATDVTYRYQNDGTNKYWVDVSGPSLLANVTNGITTAKSIAISMIFGGF